MTDEHRSVLVMLTVPSHWPDLPLEEIERKLRANEPRMTRHLAREVKRWGNRDEIDVEGLQELVNELDDRPED